MSIMSRMVQAIMSGGGNGDKRTASIDLMLERFDREINNFETLILPAPVSLPRTAFTSSNLPAEQMSPAASLSFWQLLSMLPIMLPLMFNLRRGARLYDGKFKPIRWQVDRVLLAKLEDIAKKAGASGIKYVKVPPNYIFQDLGIPHQYAIVFTVEMNKEKISTAPSFKAFKEVAIGYKKLAVISDRVARFMRRKGFAAYPGLALGGLTDYVALAERAGLGAIGYHGLLISPREGARLRINTIYTNITNLPLETQNQHLWIRDYCAICRKCIRQCPPQAIFDEPQPRDDGGMQCINHSSCRDYFMVNFGCAICLAVCPFSKAGYDKIKIAFSRFSQKRDKFKGRNSR